MIIISSYLFSICLILLLFSSCFIKCSHTWWECYECKILNLWLRSLWRFLCPSIIKEQTQEKCEPSSASPTSRSLLRNWDAFQTKKAKSAAMEANIRARADFHSQHFVAERSCPNAALEPTVPAQLRGGRQSQPSRHAAPLPGHWGALWHTQEPVCDAGARIDGYLW